MSKGWKEVARVGVSGARYPHVLVDAHGWCLRLGWNPRTDVKYYSSLPLLLRGVVEHHVRRRLASLGGPLDLEGLCREVREALASALGLCREILEQGGLEEHVRRLETQGESGTLWSTRRLAPSRPSGFHAIRGLLSDRQVL